MVGAAATAGDYVVNLEYPEGEFGPAAVAAALLSSEQNVLVLAVVDGGVNVRAAGDVGSGGYKLGVEEVAHEFLEAYVDEFDGLWGDVYADPLASELFGGDAGGGASAERVEYDVRRYWNSSR